MDNTKKFDGRAAAYTAGRPFYASALINCLYQHHGFTEQAVIADIGSGTGKFAKQLLDKGSRVFGVEPNKDMRLAAQKELGHYRRFQSVDGRADATTLPPASVDCITTAQAFHWFDVRSFQQECQRILKKGGKVVLIWNTRDMHQPFTQECYAVYAQYCRDFQGFGGGIQKEDARIQEFFHNDYTVVSFANPLYFDKKKFIQRSLSGSYSLREGDPSYAAYLGALETVFEKYAEGNTVEMQNNTVAYIGEV